MRVLFIGTLEPHPGGSGMVNAQIVRGLVARGHSVVAIAPIAREQAEDLDDMAGLAGVTVQRYVTDHTEVDSERSAPAHIDSERDNLVRLLRRTELSGTDIVLVGREAFMRYLPDLLPADARLPLVLIAHSANASGAFADPLPPAGRGVRRNMSRCTAIILVAENQREIFGGVGVPLHVIPNGVDLDDFAPTAPVDRMEVVVMHASNLKRSKRVGDFMAAAQQALSVDARLRFRIVGDGAGRADAENAISGQVAATHFELSGWRPRPLMPDAYASADIVVLMSETEAMPLVALESMACARPLIATDIPALRELLVDGLTGFLYPVGDTRRLTELMLALAADPGLRERVGAAARRAVESRGVDAMVDAYERLLLDVVAKHGRAEAWRPAAAAS